MLEAGGKISRDLVTPRDLKTSAKEVSKDFEGSKDIEGYHRWRWRGPLALAVGRWRGQLALVEPLTPAVAAGADRWRGYLPWSALYWRVRITILFPDTPLQFVFPTCVLVSIFFLTIKYKNDGTLQDVFAVPQQADLSLVGHAPDLLVPRRHAFG